MVADEQTVNVQQAILDLPISERHRHLLLPIWEGCMHKLVTIEHIVCAVT